MNNQERTKFMSEWIHEQEKARIKLDQEKWARKKREKEQSTREYNEGMLGKHKRELGMM